MLSTIDSSVYHRHINETTHHRRVRPVVIGAPYVLCGFAVGVILMAVGTFITSHAYSEEERDPVLLGVGPGLLGLGGLLLLSAVLICLVACLRNRHLRESFSDDLFTIGASTFYGGRRFAELNDESHLDDSHSPSGHRRRHSTSCSATNPNEAVMILANTVAEERERQRKNSRKFPRNRSYESRANACYTGPQEFVDRLSREEQDYLGLERIRRAAPLPELAQNFDLGESDDSGYRPRDRSYSMSVRRPAAQFPPVEHRLRRNLTYTQASRARQQQQQRERQQQKLMAEPPFHGCETQQPGPQRKRSSRRRKPQATTNEASEGPTVHQLPKYDPDLLRVLGLESVRPPLDRGVSEDGRIASGGAPPPTWWEDPDVTHSSLGSPRRRPSVVMGVRSIRPKQSGAAYRHSSSIYASDMDLHRSDAMTSDASQAGHEPRDLQSPGVSSQAFPHSGPSTANRSLGSSPTLQSPYSYGDFSPQLDRRRENSPVPSSTPSLSRGRRPLSNISSASESCCSECCESGQQDGTRGNHGHQRRQPHATSHEDTDPDTDQRPQDTDARFGCDS